MMPDRTIRLWGRNQKGQLGDGTTTDRLAPAAVPNFPPSGLTVGDVSAGANYTLATTSDGTVWSWGDNSSGQLGDGTLVDRNTPVQVTGTLCWGCTGRVSAGWDHSLALGSNLAVYAWGNNDYGQLGDGTTVSRSTADIVKGVGGLGVLGASQISAGRSHSLAADWYGNVYAWGRNDAGQLGDGTLTNSTTPVPVLGPDGVTRLGDVKSVYAWEGSGIGGGRGYSIALKTDGSLWAWGDNGDGQLGDGTTTRRPFPVRVGGPGFGSVKALSAGLSHVVASKTDGTVWTWGRNDLGQLGRTSSQTCETSIRCATSPGQVSGVANIAGVFTRFDHSIVTTTAGGTTRYSYDQLYRLTSDGTTAYTYDPVGNRRTTMVTGTTKAYVYDRADRLTSVGGQAYVTDAAGNLTQHGTDVLTYDQANRLTSYWYPYVCIEYYAYSGDGLLVTTTPSSGAGNQFHYVYDVNRSLPVLNENVFLGTKYVWGLGFAYSVDSLNNVSVSHADALTSVRSMTDANGNVLQTSQRDTFGALQSGGGAVLDFTGEMRDSITGLLYLRSRMYDPQLGRFISRDSTAGVATRPQTQNRFAYALGNPTTRRDPSGHRATADDAESSGGGDASINAPDDSAGVLPGGSIDDCLNGNRCGGGPGEPGTGGGPAGAGSSRGGSAPVLKGQAGVARAEADVISAGQTVVGRQVTVDTSAGRIRVDLIVQDQRGRTFALEVKAGSTADFTAGQLRGYRALASEGGTPVGANAIEAGFTPGVAITPMNVEAVWILP